MHATKANRCATGFRAWCFALLLTSTTAFAAAPQLFDWPQWQGPDRTAHSKETGLLKEWPKAGPPLAWRTNGLGGMIVIDGYLYGANGGNSGGELACLDFKTGNIQWDMRNDPQRRVPKGSVALADGRLDYRTEQGAMLLIEPNPKEYVERGRFEQPNRTRQLAWSHPVIANGKLYVRDQADLFCYDIKAK